MIYLPANGLYLSGKSFSFPSMNHLFIVDSEQDVTDFSKKKEYRTSFAMKQCKRRMDIAPNTPGTRKAQWALPITEAEAHTPAPVCPP